MAEPLAPLDIPVPSVPSSTRPSPITSLTTFPNPFADEPEQGILPALFTKVKNTLVGTSTPTPALNGVARLDKGYGESGFQTEAQAIAAAAKERALASKTTSPPVLVPSASVDGGIGLSKSPTHAGPSSPRRTQTTRGLKPPSITNSTSHTPSIASSSSSIPVRKLVPPGERQWRPSGAAPAQVTVSPVTSLTTTVQATAAHDSLGTSFPPKSNRAHFGLQNAIAGPSRVPHIHHIHRESLSGLRPRRSSFATIPDSPSSVSLSAMIAGNAELSQNFTYVPGFPLGQDDTRSVRSLALVKKTNSVSKIIRRIRGEGLSKHYWMADEHCKECYDCKSVFTAWRRKHHCRICGQIFCSRCASNIIGARRFGQEGAVRVCNLCLKIMEEYKDDDEDDRRSIASINTSIRHPSISDRAFLDAGLSPELPYSKSPFAASQLFSSQPDEPLSAIDESGVPARWGMTLAEDLEQQYSPNDGSDQSEDEDGHIYTMRPNTAAPFRRPMEEEQQSAGEMSENPSNAPTRPESPSTPLEDTPTREDERRSSAQMRASPRPRRVGFPRTDTISTDGGDVRPPFGRIDSNQPLIGLRTRLNSRASQGGLTALIDTEKGEGLWRARSHSFAQATRPELFSGASLAHFDLMLHQAIARANLPHPDEWHRVLSKILLRVATSLDLNVRGGDNPDVRHYVKIKKIPGGKIKDSEYIDGTVISKNVAHKAMARRLVNPRIMLVTFPLDYHRVENQFMSLEPILAQEKDYLRGLTQRIINVRPHIVLVERTVSRVALEYMLEGNVAVARSVKLSALQRVARCTQADIVASMDRLATEPRLGRCAEFRIQSFEHDLIPGRRKTIMRFEGGTRELGCTVILRGGDMETLGRVKVVTSFMAMVACQLKNEIILYNDEHNILPPAVPMSAEYRALMELLNAMPKAAATAEPPASSEDPDTTIDGSTPAQGEDHGVDAKRAAEKQEAEKRTKEIALSLQPYLTTGLSASAAIRFPPPVPLAKMADLDRLLAELRHRRDEEEAAQILHEETKAEGPKINIVEPESSTPSTLTAVSDAETAVSDVPSSSAMTAPPLTAAPGATRDPYRVLRKVEEISQESHLSQVQHEHSEQTKLWQWYTRRHNGPLAPEEYQNLQYLFSMGSEGTDKPCVEPTMQRIDFYQDDDLTLGQYLEGLANDAVKRCPKGCDRLLLFHFRLLVHGDRRLQIAMDQFPCPSPGHEDRIITWSYCRQCATPSPTTIMREETWKMSWGAYLEHCFYPPATTAGFACPHDAYRDQIRYFAHRNLAIRIHNEKIDLYEPVRPSISLRVRAETKVLLKNYEYEIALHKNTTFFDSVLFRLRSFDYDLIQPDRVTPLRTVLETMLSRAVADREEMVNLLNRTYKLTPMTDVLALNAVLRTLQDKVVQWDSDFADVERMFLPSEKDLRRMTATHLKRLFANQDVFNTLDRNVAGMTVAEADEKDLKVGDGEESQASEQEQDIKHPADESASTIAVPVEDDGMTPLAGVHEVQKNPLSIPPTPGESDDSDSTIPARGSPKAGPSKRRESTDADSDANHAFVSRLPRRSKPAASIADLVKRFQESTTGLFDPIDEASPDQPNSSASLRRSLSQRHRDMEASDSDQAPKARPRLRRGKTEQLPPRVREVSRSGLMSDSERSYAANASRIPSSLHRVTGRGSDFRVGAGGRTRGGASPSSRSRQTSPERPESSLGGLRPPSATLDPRKPRLLGKTRAPRSTEIATPLPKPASRRSLGGSPSNRVTSIARRFDRLSREAEKERQKRISAVRGKRARPVAVTKAKVQVFDNLRDAFKDESDTDSSEADNEDDDEEGSDDSGDSGDDKSPGQSPPKRRASRSPSKSPNKSPAKKDAEIPEEPAATATATVPMDVSNPTDAVTDSATDVGMSTSMASIAGQSIMSDVKSEMSFTDRLQIELPSFETSAPLPSVPATPQLSVDTADEGGSTYGGRTAKSAMSYLSESELSSGGERGSILKTLTGLWAFRAGDFTPLEYPLSAAEHIFADSRVIIRETEPTSIIAFTLSSKTYRDKMKTFGSLKAGAKMAEAFMPDEGVADRSSTWDIVNLDEAVDADELSKGEGGTHLKYDFESGSSTIFCRIFFAEKFAALRSACDCEESFIESLARCVQFDASGGKSGSAFLKTKDDRFIAKEISRLEMDALTKFAPAYFDYTRKAFQGQRPTVLAKIYGFFKIGYRNAITGRTMRMNVLIMENLFYERRFSKIYDLKGSTRNRLIQATGKHNEVLLDENLMEIAYKHPLYLRDHAKRILRTALFNDTLFLSNLNVMDYSLVVGVDSEKHELVVGVVDYIRTFTWDKKLESWVKDSAFLGGAGKGEPTIVTPKQYKTRFRTAMERFYFPAVPDRWTKLGAEDAPIEDEPSTI